MDSTLDLSNLKEFLKGTVEPWPVWLRWLEHRRYTKKLRVRSLVQVHMIGNQLMFVSHIDASLSLPLFLSLCQINKHILR